MDETHSINMNSAITIRAPSQPHVTRDT